jgi:hypothetical protein
MAEPPRSSRIIDVLLVCTVAFVAVVVAAYVYMPDFQRGLATVVSRGAPVFGY